MTNYDYSSQFGFNDYETDPEGVLLTGPNRVSFASEYDAKLKQQQRENAREVRRKALWVGLVFGVLTAIAGAGFYFVYLSMNGGAV